MFSDDASRLRDDDSLLEKGVMDSTGVLELIAYVEGEFDVKIADSEMIPENLDSVGRIAAFLRRKQQAA